jgi:hypothetical protein
MEITILLRQQLTTNIPDYTVKYGGGYLQLHYDITVPAGGPPLLTF